MHTQEINSKTGIDKIKQYNWVVKDQPGQLTMLRKDVLFVNDDYQRTSSDDKVNRIAGRWSWVACGALIVANRDGAFWVVDGQHRYRAALKRSDITHLPCIVFETDSVQTDARGFINANTERKPINVFDKYRALLVAGDPVAVKLASVLRAVNVELTRESTTRARTLKAASWALHYARENEDALRYVVGLAADLSEGQISQKLLMGLMYIHLNVEGGLKNKKLLRRIVDVGGTRLLDGAIRAAAFYANGGAKVWATGMLQEIN